MKSSGHSLCIIIKFHISTWHDLSITLKGIIGHSLCTCIWSIWYLLIYLYLYFYLISRIYLFFICRPFSRLNSDQVNLYVNQFVSINILQKIQVLSSQTLWQYHSLIIISIVLILTLIALWGGFPYILHTSYLSQCHVFLWITLYNLLPNVRFPTSRIPNSFTSCTCVTKTVQVPISWEPRVVS